MEIIKLEIEKYTVAKRKGLVQIKPVGVARITTTSLICRKAVCVDEVKILADALTDMNSAIIPATSLKRLALVQKKRREKRKTCIKRGV